MQRNLIFGEKIDCILFLQKIFGPGQKGVKWKYLEIKKPKKNIIVITAIFLLPLFIYFYLYSLCKMTAWNIWK